MSIDVLAPGFLTTVQDAGRHGFRHLGVGCAGALDGYSSQVANRIVGNPPDSALLEITLSGPRLRFDRAVRIALCGADIDALAGEHSLPGWRPIDLPAHTELVIGRCKRGARAYLAIAGGIAVPYVMGSASTDLRGGFGGLDGRALRAGDRIALGATDAIETDRIEPSRIETGRIETGRIETESIRIAPWWIDSTPDLDFDLPTIASFVPGADVTSPPNALFAQAWQVSSHSDRQGLRLDGAPIASADASEKISEPVLPGTVQLPANGQPIVLLADAQTHGGYPRIGHVIAADLPRLAQLRPGEDLHFAPVTQQQALAAWREQRQRLQRIGLAIGHKSRG